MKMNFLVYVGSIYWESGWVSALNTVPDSGRSVEPGFDIHVYYRRIQSILDHVNYLSLDM